MYPLNAQHLERLKAEGEAVQQAAPTQRWS